MTPTRLTTIIAAALSFYLATNIADSAPITIVFTENTQIWATSERLSSPTPIKISPTYKPGLNSLTESGAGPPTILATWQIDVTDANIGQTFTLDNTSPDWSIFYEASKNLHYVTSIAKGNNVIFRTVDVALFGVDDYQAWGPPRNGVECCDPLTPFYLSRAELTLTEWYSSPIGGIVKFDFQLIGDTVPEPSTIIFVGLAIVLLLLMRIIFSGARKDKR